MNAVNTPYYIIFNNFERFSQLKIYSPQTMPLQLIAKKFAVNQLRVFFDTQ